MTVVILQSGGIAAGGGDVTPDAINWGNISTVGHSGIGQNSAQVLAGIDSPIQIKAAWTSTSGSPAKGRWIKNGVSGALAVTPVYVNAVVGDSLIFSMSCVNTPGVGNYDTGTVTVTNQSDGGASLDTLTFSLQYVPGSGGIV